MGDKLYKGKRRREMIEKERERARGSVILPPFLGEWTY